MINRYTTQGIQIVQTSDGILLTCCLSNDIFLEAFYESMSEFREKLGRDTRMQEELTVYDLMEHWLYNESVGTAKAKLSEQEYAAKVVLS